MDQVKHTILDDRAATAHPPRSVHITNADKMMHIRRLISAPKTSPFALRTPILHGVVTRCRNREGFEVLREKP